MPIRRRVPAGFDLSVDYQAYQELPIGAELALDYRLPHNLTLSAHGGVSYNLLDTTAPVTAAFRKRRRHALRDGGRAGLALADDGRARARRQ